MTLQHRAYVDELSRIRLWRVFYLAIGVAAGASACAFGESEEPGCQSDAECGNGRFCRAGACFRIVGEIDADAGEGDAG